MMYSWELVTLEDVRRDSQLIKKQQYKPLAYQL